MSSLCNILKDHQTQRKIFRILSLLRKNPPLTKTSSNPWLRNLKIGKKLQSTRMMALKLKGLSWEWTRARVIVRYGLDLPREASCHTARLTKHIPFETSTRPLGARSDLSSSNVLLIEFKLTENMIRTKNKKIVRSWLAKGMLSHNISKADNTATILLNK